MCDARERYDGRVGSPAKGPRQHGRHIYESRDPVFMLITIVRYNYYERYFVCTFGSVHILMLHIYHFYMWHVVVEKTVS